MTKQNDGELVQGECVECGVELEMTLGDPIDQLRYKLKKRVWCEHCEIWLLFAIRDQSGRYWGRRRGWND